MSCEAKYSMTVAKSVPVHPETLLASTAAMHADHALLLISE